MSSTQVPNAGCVLRSLTAPLFSPPFPATVSVAWRSGPAPDSHGRALRPSPSLPEFVGRRGVPRGSLQQMLIRARPHIERLERAVHARNEWWVQGTMRKVTEITWFLVIVLLALPIPFDNLFPAWAIFFFCLALIEDDGIMAMLGWVMTVVTAVWTVFLLVVGPYVVLTLLRNLF